MRHAIRALLLGLLVVTPGVASAQPVTQFDDLALRLSLGDRAEIGLRDGSRISGRVIELTRDAIEIASSAGKRRLAAEDVGLVEVRGDSLRNGAAIGFLSGAALGVLFAGGFSDHLTAGEAVGSACIVGGVGAGIGLGIDALVERTTVVYRADRPRASLAPIVTPRAVGLIGAIRW